MRSTIKAWNSSRFAKAYADLTAACNACHQSAGHRMVVIQVPTVSAFPDQNTVWDSLRSDAERFLSLTPAMPEGVLRLPDVLR
jgi:hypothetical protein